ncbi:MAG: AMP-binding protein, partial [Deltaproteobacteria bacterium]|nr:AMP-binding protein [Deltaproteobacteria bacterium]
MLSHHNILANVESMAQIFWVTKKDTIMGVLPFFHSFGFTVTLWMPLLTGFGVVYHANPTDAKAIGELVSKYKATILIATPTFYSMYVRRCSKEEFSSLRYAIVGAEKLREPVAAAFKEKFGIELLEGYGCTEMGPVVSVNIPNVKQGGQRQVGLKPGTVGHPIPGVSVKVVDPDTGEILPADGAGMLLLKGPGRMLGYLGLAKETDEAIRDGWYVTGDIAAVDQDGFIKITDRLSRFSKIGGEMVPHLKLEETVNEILGEESSVVTAVPDEQKGERLVVFYRHDGFSPEDVFNRLRQTDLPN